MVGSGVFLVVVDFRGWLVGLLSWLAAVTFGGSYHLKFGVVGKQLGVSVRISLRKKANPIVCASMGF